MSIKEPKSPITPGETRPMREVKPDFEIQKFSGKDNDRSGPPLKDGTIKRGKPKMGLL